MSLFSKLLGKKGGKSEKKLQLTEEEKQIVQNELGMLKNDFAGLLFSKEAAIEIQHLYISRALASYADMQITDARWCNDIIEKDKLINKAVAAITKAYGFFAWPMYIYDLACFTDMQGKKDVAKIIFKKFLKLQTCFKPTHFQDKLIKSQRRDIDNAIKEATKKVKEG